MNLCAVLTLKDKNMCIIYVKDQNMCNIYTIRICVSISFSCQAIQCYPETSRILALSLGPVSGKKNTWKFENLRNLGIHVFSSNNFSNRWRCVDSSVFMLGLVPCPRIGQECLGSPGWQHCYIGPTQAHGKVVIFSCYEYPLVLYGSCPEL